MVEYRDTLLEALGIDVVRADVEGAVATMPVDHRTIQPFGYLHGGATAALLETVASLGALQHVDPETQSVFGVELCIRHVRSTRAGVVTGTATPAEIAASRQVWDVECRGATGEVLSTGTCTVRVVDRRGVGDARSADRGTGGTLTSDVAE